MHIMDKKQMEKKTVLDLLRELIQIPSINPNLSSNKEDGEMKLAFFVRDWLLDYGIKACLEEVVPGRPNVYAEIGNEEGPVLCLCAHLDTVDVQDMSIPPFQPDVVDDRVYGRGSIDMKGGLAAILCAAVALAEQKIKGKIILALVCDEEYASIGADDYVRRHRADACILTEPSDLQMVVAHKGFLWGKITVSGKCAHGSRWDLGESAIYKMGPILTGLHDLDKHVLRKRTHAIVGPASMHASLINGGIGISTYASSSIVHIERRTLPAENLDDVKKEIETVIYKNCPDALIDWYFHRPPFDCDPEEKIAKCVKEAAFHVKGNDTNAAGLPFWTDAAIFQQAGIPTVNIGPAGFGMHEPVEWASLDSVIKTSEILYHSARLYFNRKR